MHSLSWASPNFVQSWSQQLISVFFLQSCSTENEEVEDLSAGLGGIDFGRSSTATLARHDSVTDITLKLFSDPLWSDYALPATYLDLCGHPLNSRCPCLASSHAVTTRSTNTIHSGCLLPLVLRIMKSRTRRPNRINHESRLDELVLPDLIPPPATSFDLIFDIPDRCLEAHVPEEPPANIQCTQVAPDVLHPALHPAQEQCDVLIAEDPPTYRAGNASNANLPPVYEFYDPNPFFPNANVAPPVQEVEMSLGERFHNTSIARALAEAGRDGSKAATKRLGKDMLRRMCNLGRKAKGVPQVMQRMREKNHQDKARQKIAWLERHDYMSVQERLLSRDLTG